MLSGNSQSDTYTEEEPHSRHQNRMDEDVDSVDSQQSESQLLGTPELQGVSDPIDHCSSDDAMNADTTFAAPPTSHQSNGKSHSTSQQQQQGVDAYGRRSSGHSSPHSGNSSQKPGNWRKEYASTTSIKSPYSAQESTGSAADEDAAAAAALSADPSGQTASLSSTTGCYISGPLMPPAGYPMPRVGGRPDQSPPQQHMMQQEQCEQHQRLGEQQRVEQEEHQRDQQHQHLHQQHQQQHQQQRQQQQHHSQQLPFDDPRSSVISSSSSGGSSKPNSVKDKDQPPPPQWAQPPKPTGTPGPRASSFDSGLDRNVLFNPEHIRGPAGEWVEVLRGEQGRIAIKSTPTQYEVLVWLPGFSINDITIVTRKNQVLHIVADQWDEQDHAQWEIRLGDDAVMTTVRAQFSGQELKITVARSGRIPSSSMSVHSNVSMRTASSRAGSVAGNAGHSMHERSFSTPTQPWGDTDRRDLEARMNRGAEAFC